MVDRRNQSILEIISKPGSVGDNRVVQAIQKSGYIAILVLGWIAKRYNASSDNAKRGKLRIDAYFS